jgi:hypothetical protein
MFFEEDKIRSFREMIVAEDKAAREKALAKLLPLQQKDFEGIFKAMDGYPRHGTAPRPAAPRVCSSGRGADQGACKDRWHFR